MSLLSLVLLERAHVVGPPLGFIEQGQYEVRDLTRVLPGNSKIAFVLSADEGELNPIIIDGDGRKFGDPDDIIVGQGASPLGAPAALSFSGLMQVKPVRAFRKLNCCAFWPVNWSVSVANIEARA